MYTQCPQCDAAFRITVDVLQQARGQVRCGNCDAAFNALDHLTEEAPVAAGPETDGPDDLERSQLLETLDRLAGTEEVRIEDTGVEWLVVEDGEDDADEPSEDAAEATSASMRWVIEDASDRVDETADEGVSDAESAAAGSTSDTETTDEPRYDDNTELPDDFEEQHQYSAPVDPPQRRASDQFEFVVENDDAQADLELSEPDDWSDLLDDIHGEAAGGSDPEASEETAEDLQEAGGIAVDDASSAIRETDESDGTDDAASLAASMGPTPSEEQEIAMVASQLDDLLETMGSSQEPALDLSALRSGEATDDAAIASDADPAEVSADLASEDTAGDENAEADPDDPTAGDEWAAEADASEPAADEVFEASSEQPEDDSSEATSEPHDEEIEEVVAATADEDESFDDAIHDTPAAETPDDSVLATAANPLDVADLENYAADAASDAEESSDQVQTDWQEEAPEALDEIDTDFSDASDADVDREDGDGAETVAQELAAMTGNMAIDADFVRALQEGDFDATVDEDGSPLVETIIMEGESVSGALTSTSSGRIRESLKDPGSLLDTYISMRKDDEKSAWPVRRFGLAALVLLFALLIGQIVHHSRDSLATNATFQRLLGPVYEFMGSPLVPNWDIRGWQFEATNGGTDEDNSVLTIYSRLSNRAESALPYPLVHVSLTDRYEEIIGSRMLEPSDYLAGNADPGRLVAAGADFTAVITIAEPSAEATGFKLNVCYPAGGGDVRCAIEDFKTP